MDGITMDKQEIKRLFSPESVAVLGASATSGTLGYETLKNFVDLNYRGMVYPVNPRYSEVLGLRCYSSLSVTPGSVELVIMVISNHLVEEAIQECIAKGVRYVIVFSSGYAELGSEGVERQQALLSLCQLHGIRLLGPNTMGIMNIKEKMMFTFASSVRFNLLSGPVGIVSQSGAFGGTVLNVANGDEAVGFTYLAMTGNQADLNTLDFLEFMLSDHDTKVLAAYMESIPDEQRFRQIAQKALKSHKPFIVLKAGFSEQGKNAALCHTGSMTGSYESFQFIAKNYGITEVRDIDDMIDAMKVFKSGKKPKGRRVAIVSISGASGILLADHCVELGLEMSVLKEETVRQLKEVIPPFGSAVNPVDTTAMVLQKLDMLKRCLEILLHAEEVDLVIVANATGGERAVAMAGGVIDVFQAHEKPILAAFSGPLHSVGEARKLLNEASVPAFNSLRRSMKAAKMLIDYEKAYTSQQDT
jgi:acyl-CoA synthetase (NDP forming)